ncbi:uracil DNA glycosylase superfamily protein [Ferrovum sp. JA12]|uniref:uracil-DNA glycosylase n=1 Tax=Ferrovum sp. JA12 TaxID=1356299 RepID=UPI0007026827|nr:uracil-DNA glycosylase [Ferrovum sp. JA12]KRH78552.1 uracil DNA glycosylase superfamily protein [Ferrovum sp. JA12]
MNRDEALLREMNLWSTLALFQSQHAPPSLAQEESRLPTKLPPTVVPVTPETNHEKVAVLTPPSPAPSHSTNISTSLLERVNQCTACALHGVRTQAMVGQGSQSATWLLIAEAPSAEEDLHNLPLQGTAGEVLKNLLQAVELTALTDTYHCYLVKCRPQHNRPPREEEFIACRQYLMEEMALLQPRVIVLMGRIVAKLLLNLDVPLSEMRQKTYTLAGINTIVTLDMGALLRQPQEKSRAWRDFMYAKKLSM